MNTDLITLQTLHPLALQTLRTIISQLEAVSPTITQLTEKCSVVAVDGSAYVSRKAKAALLKVTSNQGNEYDPCIVQWSEHGNQRVVVVYYLSHFKCYLTCTRYYDL